MDASLIALPILPAIGLAGISLGDSVDDVIALHGAPLERREVTSAVDALKFECLFVLFDRDRAVTISAEDGYLGQTLQGAYVGMCWRELQQLYPDIYYDATWIWVPPSIDGIEFSIGVPNDDPASPFDTIDEEVEVTDPDNAFVVSISVTARGLRRGSWESVHGRLAK